MDYVLPILNILIDGGVFLCIAYIIGTVAKCYAIHKICSAEKLSDAKVKWICKMMFKSDKKSSIFSFKKHNDNQLIFNFSFLFVEESRPPTPALFLFEIEANYYHEQ